MAIGHMDIDRYEKEANFYYFLWFGIYLILGLTAILFPAMAAISIYPDTDADSRYLAAIGAAAAATYGFLKPNDYAAGFDAAIAELRSLRAALELLTPEQQAARLDTIVRLMAFKYQGDIAARSSAEAK